LEQLQSLGAAYNETMRLRLRGTLNQDALERSFTELIRRHETLRTRIQVGAGGVPVQLIDPPGPSCLKVLELTALERVEREREASDLLHEEASRPFDLSRELCRAVLVSLSPQEHLLLVVIHHIVSDVWSLFGVMRFELSRLYEAYAQGLASPLANLQVQYADYALWQRQWLQGDVLQSQVDYWKKKLADAPPALQLPTDRPRPPLPTFKGAVKQMAISPELSLQLGDLARQKGVTLYMVLLVGLQVVLSRWSGQKDILVGSPIAGRTHRQTEGLIGFFINTLVMRANLAGDPTFQELLEQVRETALEAYAHQDLPFEKLVAELQPERDLSRQALFQVMFVMLNMPMQNLELSGIGVESLDLERVQSKFDMTLSVYETESGLRGWIEYATDLFDETTIERFIGHYKRLLEQVVVHSHAQLSELSIVTAEERQRLLVEWNQTRRDYRTETCVHEQFAEQATRTPNEVALTYQAEELSYAELDRRSNRLAHYLRGLGVGPESIVGLCVERSLEMVIGLLGIMKAGGAYLPLDPQYPAERLAFMLDDSGASVLLFQERAGVKLPEYGGRCVSLEDVARDLADQPEWAPHTRTSPDNLAYMIYTSGSTGRPKAALLQHRGLANLAAAQASAFDVRPGDRVLQFASLSFDASISEIMMAFQVGAAVCLIDAGALSGADLVRSLKEFRITTVTLPPSVLPLLSLHRFPDLRTLVVAGEACPAALASEWESRCRFINARSDGDHCVCDLRGVPRCK